ncbi:MAG TPA: UDP-phosphate N-acetylglucosaminyl 1-phosphate transferase [Usitatibacter sp.]|nr:UDP-phosphate N-acetylglucosaminyl 1-phosphate transferase [Usitatibacter sp.]
MTEVSWMLLVVPAAIAWLVIAFLRRSRLAQRLADHPNERSLHAHPTPRVGGLGVLAGALPIAWLHASAPIAQLLVVAVALAVVSALDDVRSLPIQVRLPAHAAAAVMAVLVAAAPGHAGAHWPLLWLVAAVLAISWMTNLFNFMDGADGLAGGMAVIGFGALALAALAAREVALAWTAAAIASACFGFLWHNFPPARIFLGDAGSIPLGFLAGALGLAGAHAGAWPWWFPLLVFGPFIVDATFTVTRRLLRGEPIWRAHREHLYQRVALAGLSRRRLALWAYALMLAAAASGLVALRQDDTVRCAIIFVSLAFYVVVIALIMRHYRVPAAGS